MSIIAVVSPEPEVERYLDMLRYLQELAQLSKYKVSVTVLKMHDSQSSVIDNLEARVGEANEGRIKFLSEAIEL